TAVLVAESLMDGGAPRLLVAGERHLERAKALAARYEGEALGLDDARERLAEADVVIVATASARYVIERDHVGRALRARKSSPQFLIDLSVPRNVDPAVASLENAYLYNLDDLKAAANENVKRREQWLGPARAIVAEAVAGTGAWLDSLAAVPVIVSLQAFGEACRQEVLAKARALPLEARGQVEYLTQALVAKLLHRPISALKAPRGSDGEAATADLLRRLFQLK
ncbi:MAG: glutamyl-tRNA reductase, partial [bacterium]